METKNQPSNPYKSPVRPSIGAGGSPVLSAWHAMYGAYFCALFTVGCIYVLLLTGGASFFGLLRPHGIIASACYHIAAWLLPVSIVLGVFLSVFCLYRGNLRIRLCLTPASIFFAYVGWLLMKDIIGWITR